MLLSDELLTGGLFANAQMLTISLVIAMIGLLRIYKILHPHTHSVRRDRGEGEEGGF